MSNNSKIEWTEATWNPVVGCSVLSPGCTNCYAMRLARRLELMGREKYNGTTRMSGGKPKWNGTVRVDELSLNIPFRWKTGKMVFVNSMSDLFHETVSLEEIQRIFNTMKNTPQHTYQILTKRAERLEEVSSDLEWSDNIWMGVSVESAEYSFRIDCLRNTSAQLKFLSLEPLLAPIGELSLVDINWVIAGGESGFNCRPIEVNWVRSIRDQCIKAGVAFHFKQWGGTNKKKNGRELDGLIWDEFPDKVQSSILHTK